MLTDSFKKLRSNLELNQTFSDAVSQKHNAVRSVIENNGKNVEKTQLIGSLQRGTRVQPRENDTFDIDILVVLGSFYNWLPHGTPGGITPAAAMQTLHEAVTESDRYNAMVPQQDQPTVSFEYSDNIKVELVPAYIDQIGQSANGVVHTPKGRAYWIPRNGQWVLADYDYEAEYITNQNKATGGLLVPAIKMLKAVKRTFFPEMKSFHLEIIASQILPETIAARREKGLPLDDHFLIHDFFHNAGRYLTTPMRIPGSNSPTIQLDSVTAQQVANALTALGNHAQNAHGLLTEEQKKQAWKQIFGDNLPIQ